MSYEYSADITKFEGQYNLTLQKNRKIEYIVVHYTAGTSSKKGKAKSTANYFNKKTTKASADFIVDDATIIQYNCDINNQYAWHCGGSKYKTKGGSLYKICTNSNSIGIEICSSNQNNKVENPNDKSWYFTEDAIDNAALLVFDLMNVYNIPLENVVRHYDCTGKLCPGIIGWNADSGDETEWKNFKEHVAKLIEEDQESNLDDKVAELMEKNKQLSDMLDSLNNELAALKKENEKLKKSNEALQTKHSKLREVLEM